MTEFESRVAQLLDKRDLRGLDALAQNGIYASRDAEWIKEFPETKAENVLTYIDKFDRRLDGFRRHYDALSERCHPNALGHNFMFAKLDHSERAIKFYDEREPAQNAQLILPALTTLPSLRQRCRGLTI